MAKILKIENGIVSIGMPNSEIIEVQRTAINFTPNIGDEVEVFGKDDSIIITPIAKTAMQSNTNPVVQHHIHTSSGRPVNKIAYAILALFVGGLGIHKFYAGQTGMGIIYLLFCWSFIPAIVAFIEAIVALMKPADAQGNIYI